MIANEFVKHCYGVTITTLIKRSYRYENEFFFIKPFNGFMNLT